MADNGTTRLSGSPRRTLRVRQAWIAALLYACWRSRRPDGTACRCIDGSNQRVREPRCLSASLAMPVGGLRLSAHGRQLSCWCRAVNLQPHLREEFQQRHGKSILHPVSPHCRVGTGPYDPALERRLKQKGTPAQSRFAEIWFQTVAEQRDGRWPDRPSSASGGAELRCSGRGPRLETLPPEVPLPAAGLKRMAMDCAPPFSGASQGAGVSGQLGASAGSGWRPLHRKFRRVRWDRRNPGPFRNGSCSDTVRGRASGAQFPTQRPGELAPAAHAAMRRRSPGEWPDGETGSSPPSSASPSGTRFRSGSQ